MKFTPTRLRRTGAGVATGALVASALLFASPAQAVTFSTVTDVDLNVDETRATGHNEFLAGGGVRVWTEGSTSTDKAAGYFRVDQPLASAGEPSMIWAPNNANGGSNLKPSVQLVIDYDGDGSPDGILVGEPTKADGTSLYGNDWWLSNGSKAALKILAPDHGGGFGSENHGTLAQWRNAIPQAQILKSGWSLGSGVQGDGIISQIKVGSTAYRFAPSTRTTSVVTSDKVDVSATRATGHNEFRAAGGVRVYTEGATSTDKAAGYFTVGTPLSKAGKPTLAWTPASGQTAVPGNQLKVDFDGDGSVDGTLVGEPVYGANWWLADSKQFVKDNSPRTGGGNGSNWFGTIGEWSDVFPDAVIVQGGWSLGSGVKGDGVISAITVGTVTYTFAEASVPTVPVVPTVPAPPTTVTVPKSASAVDIYRVKPVSGKITTRNTVSLYAAVTIAGKPALRGTVVDIFAKGKKVGTGTVNSSGKVKATLKGKLPRGKSTLKVVLPDSTTVTGSSDSVAVRVITKK